MKLHTLILSLLLVALVGFVYSCSGLWTNLKKAAPAVIGGGIGAGFGGPVLAAVGAGVGSTIGDNAVENADLKSGDLIGSEALERELKRQQEAMAEQVKQMALVISSLRGDVASQKVALNSLAYRSQAEEHRIDWLKWIALAGLVLVILKWGRTLWVDYNKAKAMELPVMASMVKGVDAVLRKQVTQ